MGYLDTYAQLIASRGNEKLAESIRVTAEAVKDKYLSKFSFNAHEIGLLFGNVQSGKTGQVFGIISQSVDLGFPAFLLLTTDNVTLQIQTLDRVKADLQGYCICGEDDTQKFIDNCLAEPTIVVLKKNSRVLRKWANVFGSTGFMKGNPLMIIDDEADAASLNTLVNRNRQSSINKHLDSIKNGASSSVYLQVTGTPQALFLQTNLSGWHPNFTYYFKPGNGYLGGNFFFPDTKTVPKCVNIIDSLTDPVRDVVIHHLLVSGIVSAAGGRVSNCLAHPSVRTAQHDRVAKEFKDSLEWCLQHLNGEFRNALKSAYDACAPTKYAKAPFETIFNEVAALLRHSAVRVYVMNGNSPIPSEYYEKGFNIICGGNTLGRGVTFPALHTIYYTRTSKKPQADTMWQHSRMFGYDRDPGMMSLFIDSNLYNLFANLNATNNSLIAQVEAGVQNIKVYYDPSINPTRANVIDNKHVATFSGGTNYFPSDPDNDDVEALDALLSRFTADEKYYQVSLKLIVEILNHISGGPGFAMSSFLSCIRAILAENPTAQAALIVRRERNVAKGTGALLSPNDLAIGNAISDKTVLTLYKMTGEKGWNGRKLWVPNIKLPGNVVYYDVDDELLDEE